MAGADIQGVLGYPLEITNPETGKTFLIERKGFRRGRWEDWRNLWEKWNRWNRGNSENHNHRDNGNRNDQNHGN
jgi:hypothetical protein